MDSLIILSDRIDALEKKLAEHEERLDKIEDILETLENSIIIMDKVIDKLIEGVYPLGNN